MIVGILGGGQLAMMLVEAGKLLGIEFRIFSESSSVSAKKVAPLIEGTFADQRALEEFASGLDAITYEWENIPIEAARFLASRVPRFFPSPGILEIIQDRFTQKSYFERLGVPTAKFGKVPEESQLEKVVQSIGLPGILKTTRFGYDGKGQRVLRKKEDLIGAWKALGEVELIYESFVPFQRELSLLAARSELGEEKFYPLVENHHFEGILRKTVAPAPGPSAEAMSELQKMAEGYAKKVFADSKYVGVLCLELFQLNDLLFLNEMASRVHNSGHWTIEGAKTSQFENHLRAGLALPLGATSSTGAVAMFNLIGRLPDLKKISQLPGAAVHLYGKEPRAGRKLGHVSVCASNLQQLEPVIKSLEQIISLPRKAYGSQPL